MTVECAVPAERAFAFLCDGALLGRWALGCWQTELRGDGLFVGRSLFDGGAVWARPIGDARLLTVDYHVGGRPTRSSRRSWRASCRAPAWAAAPRPAS